MILGYY